MSVSLEEKQYPLRYHQFHSLSVTVKGSASCVQWPWNCTIITEHLECVVMLLMVVRTTAASRPWREENVPECLCFFPLPHCVSMCSFHLYVHLCFPLTFSDAIRSLFCPASFSLFLVKGAHFPCISPPIICIPNQLIFHPPLHPPPLFLSISRYP